MQSTIGGKRKISHEDKSMYQRGWRTSRIFFRGGRATRLKKYHVVARRKATFYPAAKHVERSGGEGEGWGFVWVILRM